LDDGVNDMSIVNELAKKGYADLTIEIDNNYTIVIDRHNHTLFAKTEKHKTPRTVGYYGSVEQCLRAIIVDMNANNKVVTGIHGYIDNLYAVYSELDKKIGTMAEKVVLKAKKYIKRKGVTDDE